DEFCQRCVSQGLNDSHAETMENSRQGEGNAHKTAHLSRAHSHSSARVKYCSWHRIQGCKCVANHWVDCIKTECDERGCIADSSNAKLSQYGEGLANGSKRCDEEAKQRD